MLLFGALGGLCLLLGLLGNLQSLGIVSDVKNRFSDLTKVQIG